MVKVLVIEEADAMATHSTSFLTVAGVGLSCIVASPLTAE